MENLHSSHVDRWIYVNRATIFKEIKAFGDELRKYFPTAYTEWAEENGRTYGKKYGA